MFPQQQHHVPFTNLQQQYCSANPFPLPFPLPSDSPLNPPGTDPLGNPTPSAVATYGGQTADPQNWIVKQADPIRYDLAVGPSHETLAAPAGMPSAWYTWSHQFVTNNTTLMSPNQTEGSKSLRCEVCNIDCNSEDVYEKHMSGKKHRKNMQFHTDPTNTLLAGPSHPSVQSHASSVPGQVLIGAVGKELEHKKRKLLNCGVPSDSIKVCTVCKVVCNSQDVFNKHLAGKMHAAQVALMSNDEIGPYIAAFKHHGVGPWEQAPKKIKVGQSTWCEVCKINCTSRDVYVMHLSGKKHLKNLEKLSEPKIDAGPGATTTNVLQHAANPIIGPQEKPDSDQLKSQMAPEIDIETKKRKVVEGGAAAAAVRMCTLCNVVCNSQTVFNAHLTGQKHAAMVKKQVESRGATTG